MHLNFPSSYNVRYIVEYKISGYPYWLLNSSSTVAQPTRKPRLKHWSNETVRWWYLAIVDVVPSWFEINSSGTDENIFGTSNMNHETWAEQYPSTRFIYRQVMFFARGPVNTSHRVSHEPHSNGFQNRPQWFVLCIFLQERIFLSAIFIVIFIVYDTFSSVVYDC